MSKNKNKNTAPQTVESVQEQMAKLQAQLQELQAQEAKAREEQKNKAIEIVNNLVAYLNEKGVPVADLNDVISVIHQVRKGTFGGKTTINVGERKPRVELTEEQKKEVVSIYSAARAAGATPEAVQKGQRSAICAAFNISAPTLHNILDAAGLVQKRAKA